MKKIPLTQGQEAIVDDWWYDYLMQWKWFAWKDSTTGSFYAGRTEGQKPNQRFFSMHRVVAQTPDGMLCDHIHHNTLDNRESELRNVTDSQSGINRGTRKDNKLGVKGVCRKGSGYNAYLDFQRNRVLNKTFPTLDEAIKARKEAEEKYFGEFAKQ